MKKIFGLFVFGILASSAYANDICLKIEGWYIDMETGICTECVDKKFTPAPPSCLEDYAVCDARSPGSILCNNALNECKAISIIRSENAWKKKSS